MRLKLRATSEGAFTDPEYPSTVFVLDDPRTAVTTSKTVQLYLADTAQPTVRPMYVGNAKAGGVTKIPYKSPLAQTVRVYAVSEDEEGQLSTLDVTQAEYDDIAVPPLTGTFLSLTDTPSAYTSQALKAVRVNAGETALEFYTPSSGITIGSTAISSGTNGEFLYQASSAVSQTPRLSYDGTSVVVGDTVSRTSTEIIFKTQADGGFGTFTLFEQKAAGDVVFRDRFAVSVFSYNSSTEIWSSPKTFEIAEIRSSSRYLTPKLVGYNDNNRELNINQTGIAFRLTDASNNAKLLQMYSTAATAQLEVGYDTSNYYKTTVGSTGTVTFDAVGSGAKFVFSDAVEINGSLTLSAQNIVTDTTTGMKIGTGTTQKLGFFNATPVTQRTNIGAITDSTGGTPGTSVDDVGGSFDQSTLNDNFATLVQKMNAVEQVLQDLGLTS